MAALYFVAWMQRNAIREEQSAIARLHFIQVAFLTLGIPSDAEKLDAKFKKDCISLSHR